MTKPTRRKKIGRNDPCHCGSGLKLKRCHGDYVKIEMAGRAYQAKFNELIEAEKQKAVTKTVISFEGEEHELENLGVPKCK